MAVDQVQQTQNVTVLGYLLKRRKQIRIFIFLVSLAVFFFLLFAAGEIYKQVTIMREYEVYIGIADSTEYDAKIQSYISGIKLLPSDPQAYIKLLETYEKNGVFDQEQSGEFTAYYNQYSGKIKAKNTGDLNYKAGRMYFNLYTEQGEQVSMSARVQKSASYFEACVENPPKDPVEADVAACYNTICNYYKNYILKSSDNREITEETISSLMNAANNAINAVKNSGEYDQLLLYSSVCNFLYDQRAAIAKAYAGRRDEVTGLLDQIKSLTEEITVAKEESSKVQKMILDNIDDYKTAITVAYD